MEQSGAKTAAFQMHRADQITAGRDSIWIARDSAPHSHAEFHQLLKKFAATPPLCYFVPWLLKSRTVRSVQEGFAAIEFATNSS